MKNKWKFPIKKRMNTNKRENNPAPGYAPFKLEPLAVDGHFFLLGTIIRSVDRKKISCQLF